MNRIITIDFMLSLSFLLFALISLFFLAGCHHGSRIQAPANLSYSNSPAVYTMGTVITPMSSSSDGGAPDSYTVSPALPAGLSLDADSGVISGTPTAITGMANYTVTAINSAGNTTVDVTITVNPLPPTISVQPADQSVALGQTATFSVTAAGSGTLDYQWYKNDFVIGGATSSSYTTQATIEADNGALFKVLVSDGYGGSVTSSAASLTAVDQIGMMCNDAYSGNFNSYTPTVTPSATSQNEMTNACCPGYFYSYATNTCNAMTSITTYTCPANHHIVGFFSSAGAAFDGLQFYCDTPADFYANGQAGSITTVVARPDTSHVLQTDYCQNSQAVTKLNVWNEYQEWSNTEGGGTFDAGMNPFSCVAPTPYSRSGSQGFGCYSDLITAHHDQTDSTSFQMVCNDLPAYPGTNTEYTSGNFNSNFTNLPTIFNDSPTPPGTPGPGLICPDGEYAYGIGIWYGNGTFTPANSQPPETYTSDSFWGTGQVVQLLCR